MAPSGQLSGEANHETCRRQGDNGRSKKLLKFQHEPASAGLRDALNVLTREAGEI
jgi:hypothetical protein